jgi:hypothetical protein
MWCYNLEVLVEVQNNFPWIFCMINNTWSFSWYYLNKTIYTISFMHNRIRIMPKNVKKGFTNKCNMKDDITKKIGFRNSNFF